MKVKKFKSSIRYSGTMLYDLFYKTASPCDTYLSMLDRFVNNCKRLIDYAKKHNGIDYYSIDTKTSKGDDGYQRYELEFYITEKSGAFHMLTLEMVYYYEEVE